MSDDEPEGGGESSLGGRTAFAGRLMNSTTTKGETYG